MCGASHVKANQRLSVDGYSWAEQLAFDGLGSLFISDAVRGELTRIYQGGKDNLIIF